MRKLLSHRATSSYEPPEKCYEGARLLARAMLA